MGLTTEDGSPERDAVAVFGTIFAGQFFDDLCDYYQDYESVQETVAQIFHTAEQANPKQKFLLICLQYDNIYRSLPDSVWWISGQTLTFINKSTGRLELIKVSESDRTKRIPNVTFEVRKMDGALVDTITTDKQGYIYLDDLTVQGKGKLFIRELEAAPGYELDKQYKTIYGQPGKTIEIKWENTPITVQFQIYKYAAEYNEVTGAPAGAPL